MTTRGGKRPGAGRKRDPRDLVKNGRWRMRRTYIEQLESESVRLGMTHTDALDHVLRVGLAALGRRGS